jgi:hypothetical protein
MANRPRELLSKLKGKPLARRVLLAEILGPPRAREPFEPRVLPPAPKPEEP